MDQKIDEKIAGKVERKESLKRKILINAHLTVVVVLVLTFSSYFYVFHSQFKQNIKQRLLSLAQTAALLINSDEHDRLKTTADEKSTEYMQIKKILQDFKKANPDIKYIYTMRKTGKPDVWAFVVDAEPADSEDLSHIGDTYDVKLESYEMKKAFDGPIADEDFGTDKWGAVLSGYAPIRDKAGKATAIVGMDISVDSLIQQERLMFAGAIIVFIISMGLITYNTRKTTNYFLVPLKSIMEGVEQLRDGNLDHRIELETKDELADIADMLNNTAEIVRDYLAIMEEDLEHAKDQKDKLFFIYRDVIYSVTQGKFNLVDLDEALPVTQEGILHGEVKLETPEDIATARQFVTDCLKEKSFPQKSIMHTTLCISEAATNVIKHAKEGKVQIKMIDDAVRVVVLDKGPGMEYGKLPNMIFLEGFSTKISMGYGFSIIYKFADKIHLFTSKEGTILVLDFNNGTERELVA